MFAITYMTCKLRTFKYLNPKHLAGTNKVIIEDLYIDTCTFVDGFVRF